MTIGRFLASFPDTARRAGTALFYNSAHHRVYASLRAGIFETVRPL